MRRFALPGLLAAVAVGCLVIGGLKQHERNTGTFSAYGDPPDLTIIGMPVAWPWLVAGAALLVASAVAAWRTQR